MVIPIRLRDEAVVRPGLVALIGHAAGISHALEGMIRLVRLIYPRVEQRDVPGRAAGAGSQRADQVAGQQVVPADAVRNLGQRDGAQAGRQVQGHADEARAVGAVGLALWVRGVLVHGVGDVLLHPEVGALDDFIARDGGRGGRGERRRQDREAGEMHGWNA